MRMKSSKSCFHGNDFTLANVKIFQVWLVISRSCKLKVTKNRCKRFCKFHRTHVKVIKMVVSKKEHVFNAPDNHSNKEVNVDVISNVMTFLTLRFIVQTVYSF